MRRAPTATLLLPCAAWLAFGQTADSTARFDIAGVRVSAKMQNPNVRVSPVRGGRYEIKTATLVDLIHLAYGFDLDKIVGGPSWLEMERYDIEAKVPPEATADQQKQMLQALLAERFHLAVHKDTKPLPTYALALGKKLQIKEADGKGESGCKPQSSGASSEGTVMLRSLSSTGTTTTLRLGPGMTVQYECRNITMAAFTEGLRDMMGASLGHNPVLDETGLKGIWNFDFKWSLQLNGLVLPGGTDGRITIFEAVDKQLGLKLEERQVPTAVLVVDSAERMPTADPPGLEEALPPIPIPTEFEVASVKVTDPNDRMMRYQLQPGGRLTVQGMPMSTILSRAFNTSSTSQLAGVPKWADTDRFDIIAKAPSDGPDAAPLNMEQTAPMLLSLLKDRFKMTSHREDREVSAYRLVAAKPKLKKADPASRTNCKNGNAPSGATAGSRMLTCQNVTLAEFAERLRGMTAELSWPVLDATGIDGTWDIAVTYSGTIVFANPKGPDAGAGAPSASDPSGGYTLFEALEKQLGLKLEAQKRTLPVIVIDHIEQKPTEN